MICPILFQISRLSDPFSGKFGYRYVGGPKDYVHMKFGRSRLVNKNFRAVGVVKTEIPYFWVDRPFFHTSHQRRRGHMTDNLLLNFGENRLENKNFSFLGVVRQPFFKIFTSALKNVP